LTPATAESKPASGKGEVKKGKRKKQG